MATILEKSNEILADKNANLLPENLKSGVKCLGVDGTFTGDATATAEDVIEGKTAYVNGEKITGTIGYVNAPNINDKTPDLRVTAGDEFGILEIAGSLENGKSILAENSYFIAEASYERVAEAIGLTEDKIGYGETILGVDGAYGKNILFNDEYGTMCNLTSGAVVLPGELVSGGNIPDYEVEYLAAINNVYYNGTNLELDCVISFSADVQDVRAYGILDFNEGERMETERFDFDNSTIERFHNRINLTFRDVDIEQFVNDAMAISIIVETTLNDEN